MAQRLSGQPGTFRASLGRAWTHVIARDPNRHGPSQQRAGPGTTLFVPCLTGLGPGPYRAARMNIYIYTRYTTTSIHISRLCDDRNEQSSRRLAHAITAVTVTVS
jgi:hypothetical protein